MFRIDGEELCVNKRCATMRVLIEVDLMHCDIIISGVNGCRDTEWRRIVIAYSSWMVSSLDTEDAAIGAWANCFAAASRNIAQRG